MRIIKTNFLRITGTILILILLVSLLLPSAPAYSADIPEDTNTTQNVENLNSFDSQTEVIFTEPADGAVEVPLTGPIIIQFSQPVERINTEQSFMIIPDVEGSFEWNEDFTRMTFLPASLLNSGTAYTVRMDNNFSFSFRTESNFKYDEEVSERQEEFLSLEEEDLFRDRKSKERGYSPFHDNDTILNRVSSDLGQTVSQTEISLAETTEDPVIIPDTGLEIAIRQALNKHSGDIYQSDLASLEGLNAATRDISDLSGIQYCSNLTELDLWDNNIVDISLLSGLTNLVRLDLGDNNIETISPLAYLVNLENLDLFDNQIEDISSLASLTNLTVLNLNINRISDITGITGLTNLQYLFILKNDITDLPALISLTNLSDLNLDFNKITTIDALTGLTNLEELSLYSNYIDDISPIASLNRLKTLYLGSNQIYDINSLTSLINLETLDISKNKVDNLTALESLVNLNELDISSNPNSEISMLARLTNLQTLYLRSSHIRNISDLRSLTKLATLNLDNNEIVDITPLTELVNLEYLYLGHNQISDLSSLASLTNLAELSLRSNQIENISPLASLTKLRDINLNYNQISDISPLSGLTNLKYINLYDNRVSNVHLAGLLDLLSLDLRNNQISSVVLTGLPNLEDLLLGRNMISSVFLTDLSNLQSLNISNNQITDFSFSGLTNLEFLDLSHNQIEDISTLTTLSALIELDLSSNNIIDLGPIAGNIELKYLDFSSNQIKYITTLSSLTKLNYLYLENNQIDNISSLAGLNNLINLNIFKNKIEDITALESLVKIKNLNLAHNQIIDIIPLTGLYNLEVLDIYQNQIKSVNLTGYNNLNYLNLSYNLISSISLTDLISLESLNISNNQITDFSSSGFNKLKSLNISCNQINNLNLTGIPDLQRLYVQNNLLTSITLSDLINVEYLDMSHNRIKELKLSGFNNLQSLYLENNFITQLSFSGLNKLDRLNLGFNQINELSSLATLTNLRNLVLNSNQIDNLSALAGLDKLEYLYLDDNQLSDVSELGTLTNLIYLTLNSNRMNNLISLKDMDFLRYLELSNNRISDISPLGSLTDVGFLVLDNNQIDNLTPLTSLKNLTSLHLCYNQLTEINSITELEQIDYLDLSHNQINNLNWISGLNNLEELLLEDNFITNISLSNLNHIGHLYRLDISHNQIVSVSISSLTNLGYLKLNDNNINNIALENLYSLNYLYIQNNQISDISVFSSLKNLRYLYLSNNLIIDLSALKFLTDLQSLFISNNRISDISSLRPLTGLCSLDLSSNRITDISVLTSLTDLDVLSIANNQITDISSLETLTGVYFLDLGFNRISDISVLDGLESLRWIYLDDNQIEDISPLVNNSGIGSGDYLDITCNNLDLDSGSQDRSDIQALINRDVNITEKYLYQIRLLAVQNSKYQSANDLPQNPRIGFLNDGDGYWLQTALNSYAKGPFIFRKLSHMEAYTYLTQGDLDAILITGHPDILSIYYFTDSYDEKIGFIPWSEEAVNAVVQAYPDQVMASVLPANTYPGQDTDLFGYAPTQTQTKTDLVSYDSTSDYGQPVTFTASVSKLNPDNGTPTGTVTFKDGNTILTIAGLSVSGQASYETSSLAVGTHSITAVYSGDAYFAGSVSDTLIQKVNSPSLSITPEFLPDGDVKANYSQNLKAINGTGKYKWTVKKGYKLPSGLKLKADKLDSSIATISGKPSKTVKDYTFYIQVTDTGNKEVAEKSYMLTINPAICLTIPKTRTGIAGVAFPDWAPYVSGGNGEYIWSYTGSLPEGLNLDNETGKISGTPVKADSYKITLTVADTLGGTASKKVTFKIGEALKITTESLPAGEIGLTYKSVKLKATGGTKDYTWSAVKLPAGLSLSSKGVLSGTPVEEEDTSLAVSPGGGGSGGGGGGQDPGYYIYVNDGICTVKRAFQIRIYDRLEISELPDGVTGQYYSLKLADYTDGGNGEYKFSKVGSLPKWLKLDTKTGTLYGTPTASGTSEFKIKVTDGLKGTRTQTLAIKVISVTKPITLVFSSHNPENGFWANKVIKPYFAELEKRTNGQIKIEEHWNGELVSLKDAYLAMVAGDIDLVEWMPSTLQGRFPMDNVISFTQYNSNRPARVLYETSHSYPEMLEPYSEGKTLLRNLTYSAGMFTTKKQIKDLANSKGIKLGPVGTWSSKLMVAYGWVPAPVPPEETTTALQVGIQEGTGASWDQLSESDWSSIVKYHTAPVCCDEMMINLSMNKEVWDSLPEDVRDTIDGMQEWAINFQDEAIVKNAIESQAIAEAEFGITTYTLPQPEIDRMIELSIVVRAEYIKSLQEAGLPNQAFVEKYLQLSKKYAGSEYLPG